MNKYTEKELLYLKVVLLHWRDINIGYAKGFNDACELFDHALSDLGPITISVDHAKKLVGLIRRMQKEKSK